MRKYILRRIFQILITLLVFQTLLFVILDAQPGDFTLQFLTDPRVSPTIRDQMRTAMGLDRPVLERYGRWLLNFVTGNLGVSFHHYPRPVIDVILERAPRTVFLFLTALLVSFLVGYLLGKQLAWRRGGTFEFSWTFVGVILYTIFTPWFGLMMIYLFGLRLGWLPVGKFLDPLLWREAPVTANYVFHRLGLTGIALLIIIGLLFFLTRNASPKSRGPLRWGGLVVSVGAAIALWFPTGIGYLATDILKHMILPIAVFTLVTFTKPMLMMRNSMLETLREDYVMAARAKGLTEVEVRDKHAARNAFLPVFTDLTITIPFMLSGGIITESVFSWPGMGLTLLEAVQYEDVPLAMGALSFVGVLALLAHLVADIAYAFLDPRIRYQ